MGKFEKGHKINVGRKRKPFTEGTRRKMSEAKKGKHQSSQTEFKKGMNGEKRPQKAIHADYPYVLEHRVAVEKIIGRYLTKNEADQF